MTLSDDTVVRSAQQAWDRGYTPVPLRSRQKRPALAKWTDLTYATREDVARVFAEADDVGGVGLALGDASGGLVDVDLDHPKAQRAAAAILPSTSMETGRPSSRWSHRWYRVTGEVPATRRYQMPDKSVSVELRSSGAQTVVPPSVHPTGEQYRWEGTAWGEPLEIAGHVLAARVATLAMVAVLLDGWPGSGGRHAAYLGLAGGLLRTPDGVHPLWEAAIEQVVGTLADLTDDEDGSEVRIAETVPSTLRRLRQGKTAQGWPSLAEIVGVKHVELAREYAREVEFLLGFGARASTHPEEPLVAGPPPEPHEEPEEGEDLSEGARSSWTSVDLGPYVRGEVERPQPEWLVRDDGQGLIYPGRVNYLYSKRESGKSWVSLLLVKERLEAGEAVVLVDLEDEPATAVARLQALGTPDDLIEHGLAYVQPDTYIDAMLPRKAWEMRAEALRQADPEEPQPTPDADWDALLRDVDPTLIVVDGMTVLYALHGLSSNDSVETESITGWLKRQCRGGRRSVVLIDHVTKSAARGADPIGSQHKMAMVQGAAYHLWNVDPIVPGGTGKIEAILGKDRHGSIRQASVGDPPVSAVFTFTASEDGRTMEARVGVPEEVLSIGSTAEVEDAHGALIELSEKVLRALGDHDDAGMSRNALEQAVGKRAGSTPKGKPRALEQVLSMLTAEGRVEEYPGDRNARMVRLRQIGGEG